MDEAVSVLRKGGIVLYPTDTVYGLAVDATNAEAVRKLAELKGRVGKKPISIAVSDLEMAGKYVVLTPLARMLAAKFLPGKLTIILTAIDRKTPRGDFVSMENAYLAPEITAGTGTVGIRIPAHPTALQLIKDFGKPITATSANVSDMPTMNSVPEILQQFGNKNSSIYGTGGGEILPKNEPSTVVDARGEAPIILRDGALSREKIESVVKA